MAGLLALLGALSAHADQSSIHILGPVDMMYDLPAGSTPGWSSSTWVNYELSTQNTWSHGANFTDTRNGNKYYFSADYEQETSVIEFGRALTNNFAVEIEVPYGIHDGGFMDDAVDRFHQLIWSDRFMRDASPKFGNHYVIQTNGVNMLASEHMGGVGNVKAKAKYWLWHWNSPTPGACDCGFSISAQGKVPVQRRENGLTSGSQDYSGLLHFGIPLNKMSGAWATAAYTKLGPNGTFAGWPRRDWQQMYELQLNIGVMQGFGILLMARTESPLFNKSDLAFNYTSSDPQMQLEERVSSGWNYLVEWRGYEDIGLRWSWGKGNSFSFLFQEDWGIGNQDQSADGLYINDAPDFQFLTQLHLVF